MRALGSAEVLKMAATLDGIFSSGLAGAAGDLKKPEVPRLVIVGTQSSGKSRLLNGIMGADILPLGEQMVTRAPLSIQLLHNPDPTAMRAEFGDFSKGGWVACEKIPLACPVSVARWSHVERSHTLIRPSAEPEKRRTSLGSSAKATASPKVAASGVASTESRNASTLPLSVSKV